jgi:hypothetical protein
MLPADDTIAFGGNILSNHSSVYPKCFLLSLSNIVPPPSPFLFPFSLLILVVFTYLPTRLHAALTDDGHPHIFNHHPTMYYQPPPLAHCNGFAPATTRLEPIHAELRGRKKQKK